MIMQMTVKIEGVEQFTSDLKRFTGHYVERPFIDKHLVGRLQKAFFRYMAKVFRTEGSASGGKWKKLSPKYKTWKAKKYPGKTILRREDKLYESLTTKSKDHHKSVHGNPVGSELWLGSEVPYAVYHDSKKPRTSNLPRRPILRLSDAMIKGLHRIIQKHVARGIKTSMGKSKAA